MSATDEAPGIVGVGPGPTPERDARHDDPAEGAPASAADHGSEAEAHGAVGGPAAADAAATSDPGSTPGLDGPDASLLGLVDRLAAILERSDLLELEVQAGATGLILRRPEALAPVAPAAASTSPAVTAPPGGPAGQEAERATEKAAEPARASVKAPLTGIWYSAPSPGSAPFVHVGGEVAVGQVIGLIEAMTLFTEIKSALAGRVVRVAAENGQLVKAKQPLIEVEPL